MPLIAKRLVYAGLALLAAILLTAYSPADELADGTGKLEAQPVDLWFFWTSSCPHCREAQPAIEELAEELPWLRLHSLRVDGRPDNVATYRKMASVLGQHARSVPAFIYCDRMLVGWDSAGSTRKALLDGLSNCRGSGDREQREPPLVLPVLGELDLRSWSLPAFTLAIAALDSFNPCAFFVLLFLLSLLIHAGSRARMLLVGGVFVLFSGIVYFVAMAAWLNLFALVGHLALVTRLAGAVAVLIAAVNIKDYFWFRQVVTLSISDSHRDSLMARMRNLVSTGSLPGMLAATVSLALVANLYELLCTAGFPMVYTRLLTLHDLSAGRYYLYLVFYNLVYIVPLLLIVTVFAVTLGRRKLQEREGRILKLLSGLLMLGLGLVLLLVPDALNSVGTALLLPLAAMAGTWLVVKLAPRGATGRR